MITALTKQPPDLFQNFISGQPVVSHDTSSTAHGGGRSSKDRKPKGEAWLFWTERWFRLYFYLSFYISIYLPISLSLCPPLPICLSSLSAYLSMSPRPQVDCLSPICLSCRSVCLSTSLSFHLSLYQSIYPVYLFICPSVYLFLCLTVYLLICLSFYPFLCVCVSLSLSLLIHQSSNLPFYQSIYLSFIHPSVRLSIYPSNCVSIHASVRLSEGRTTCPSQNVQKTSGSKISKRFRQASCSKCALGCGTKHTWKPEP